MTELHLFLWIIRGSLLRLGFSDREFWSVDKLEPVVVDAGKTQSTWTAPE